MAVEGEGPQAAGESESVRHSFIRTPPVHVCDICDSLVAFSFLPISVCCVRVACRTAERRRTRVRHTQMNVTHQTHSISATRVCVSSMVCADDVAEEDNNGGGQPDGQDDNDADSGESTAPHTD